MCHWNPWTVQGQCLESKAFDTNLSLLGVGGRWLFFSGEENWGASSSFSGIAMLPSPRISIQTLSLCLDQRERELLYTVVQGGRLHVEAVFTGVPLYGVVPFWRPYAEMTRNLLGKNLRWGQRQWDNTNLVQGTKLSVRLWERLSWERRPAIISIGPGVT